MEKKLKHLEFIQNVINRMASNSFIIKGWCITLIVGLFALVEKEIIQNYILFSFIPLLFFWFLDAYFLKKEKEYRELYDDVREKEEEEIDFSMKIEQKKCYGNSFFSQTLIFFYFIPLLVLIITFLIIIYGIQI